MDLSAVGYNLLLYDELESVLGRLSERGIDTIALKGIVFAQTIYQDISERVLSDIDLLVKLPDFEGAKAVLLSLGYEHFPYSATTFIRPGSVPVAVDLHVGLKHLEHISMERVWAEAIPVCLGRACSKMLSHEDTLIYCISHAVLSHGYFEAKWSRDIDLFVRHYAEVIRWDLVIARAKENGLHIPVYHALRMHRRVFKTPVPDDALKELSPSGAEWLPSLIFERIVEQKRALPGMEYVLPVIVKPGIAGRLGVILRALFPSRQVMARKYHIRHEGLVYFFYLYRMAALLWRGFKAMFFMARALLIKGK
jgi:hypothetical protein